MAIIQGNAKQGSTRGFYPKVINGSLRFNDPDNPYLSWTPASAGDRKTFTYSCWVKRSLLSSGATFGITAATGGSSTDPRTQMLFNSDHKINIGFNNGSGWTEQTSSAVFRDVSAWYHIVVSVDMTQATSTDRVKLYVNGVSQTFSAYSVFAQNTDLPINNTIPHSIGRYQSGGTNPFDGYLANVHFIDGQALTASDFGETKNGVWVAKDYAGTFGTNGFYLTFEDDTQVEAFNTVLWRGNGATQSVTGVGFQPDLVWLKERSSTSGHNLVDAVRGVSLRLASNTTSAEASSSTLMTSFDSDGFSVGNNGGSNESGQTYVAWCWKAGDSNVSNPDGTITSTVRANDTYGFSIVSYQGTLADANIGHGLSSAPDMIIIKNRNRAAGTPWVVYHSALGASQRVLLNDTASASSSGNIFGSTPTAPDADVFYVGNVNWVNNNVSGENDHIAYCWSETTGYSKFGSYSGDNTTDGSNETTVGFKPAFVIIKNTGSGENWNIYDNTRFTDGDGYIEGNLFASSSSAEVTTAPIEFTATGFAPRASGGGVNASGSTYIYAAFADTREAAFWLDQSGNDNDWQPVNLDHNDTVADSPTNNFATLNPLSVPSSPSRTFSDGNLRFDATTNNAKALGTILLPTSGQWYWEATQLGGTTYATIGVADANYNNETTGRIGYRNDGNKIDETNTVSSYGTTYQSGDTIGVAFDADADTLTFYKNGTSQGTAFTGMAARSDNGLVPFVQAYTTTPFEFNFGQQPFKYDPPA